MAHNFCRAFSFGGERDFQIQEKSSSNSNVSKPLTVRLRQGHLLAMNGFFQEEFVHR